MPRKTLTNFPWLSAWLALLLVNAAALAQPAPQLTAVSPDAAVRGSAVELTLSGDQLAGAMRVIVLDTDAVAAELAADASAQPTALLVREDAAKFDAAVTAAEAKRIVVRLAIAPDAAVGRREVRVVTASGVSNPVTLFVTDRPDVTEAEPNNNVVRAQPIDQPATVTGVISSGGEIDCFRISAARGQRLVFNVWAQRIGSPLDASIDLVDAATGRVVAGNEDRFGSDPFIDYTAERAGDYVLRLRDLRFRGGGDYRYRLTLGAAPHLAAVFPLDVQRGQPAGLRLIGANLPEQAIAVNLAGDAPLGPRRVRAATRAGVSDVAPLSVTDAAPFMEAEPNDKPADEAAAHHVLTAPVVINGRLDKPGDVDVFRFRPGGHTRLIAEVTARRIGSPVDALLELGDANGNVITRNDESAEAGGDARIDRGDFKADAAGGVYTVSVRDLLGRGGEAYVYRLSIYPPPPGDFAVRFRPDRIRIHRGGHAVVWADVQRRDGFAGDVTLAFDGLPAGVHAEPVVFRGDSPAQRVFVIAADADAELASRKVELVASASVKDGAVTRTGEPEIENAQIVRHAFITVLGEAPFTVAPVGPPSEEENARLAAEVKRVEQAIGADTPQLAAAQAKWEAEALGVIDGAIAMSPWQHIGPFSGGDAFAMAYEPEKGVELDKAYDNGRLKWQARPEWEDGVVHNPWDTAGAANYLYRTISVAAPRKLPVSLGSDDGIKMFLNGVEVLANNIGRGAAPDQEQVTLDLKAGDNALLIKIVNGGGPSGFYFKADAKSHGIPPAIAAILRTEAAQRSDEQKRQLTAYYRSIDPSLAGLRAKLEELQKQVDPKALIAQLRSQLEVQTPELDAALARWEASGAATRANAWSTVSISEAKAESGAQLQPQADGSLLVTGANPAKDTYELRGRVQARRITAIRLEAMADPSLPAGGPGRAGNGNFVLSSFIVEAGAGGDAAALAPVELAGGRATFEQGGFPAANALNDDGNSGWAVSPQFGKTHMAIFPLETPLESASGEVALRIVLKQQSPHSQHNLGRVRISVIGSDDPQFDSPTLPGGVLAALNTPRDQRSDEQQTALAAYYRSIAPELQPIRDRIAELEAMEAGFPPTVARKGSTTMLVEVKRAGSFTGDVTVTLEGFSTGRDGKGNPNPLAANLDVQPVVLKGDATRALLTIAAKEKAELGARPVVIKAEAQVNGYTVTQYSEAVTVTVKE